MTRPAQAIKPHKPYPTFPLTPHPSGQWAKKVHGSTCDFGPWSDPQGALEQYHKQAANLHAGYGSTIPTGDVTVKELVNSYLNYQQDKVVSGEIGPRHFEDCRRTVSEWARFVGKVRAVSDIVPEEFGRYRARFAKRLGALSLGKHITVIRCMFNYAVDVDLIDRSPRLSKVFAPPSAHVIRRDQRQDELANGKKLFTPQDLRTIIDTAAGCQVVTPAASTHSGTRSAPGRVK